MKLQDKVALITGAGSGLGRASAILFASAGASIGVADINLESAEETANEISRAEDGARIRALWMNPGDASQLGVQSGGRVRITTKRASAESVVELTDTMLPGHVALPNGTGLWYPDREGQEFQHGVAPNELTVTEDRDWFAGTPFHKHVPARIEALA